MKFELMYVFPWCMSAVVVLVVGLTSDITTVAWALGIFNVIQTSLLILTFYQQKKLSGSGPNVETVHYVAHEIRTALSGVVGVVPMLRQTTLSVDQSALVDLIDVSGNHMMMFVNGILDHAKLQAGCLEIVLSRVFILEEIEKAVMMCAPSSRARGIDLNVYVSHTISPVKTDSIRLRQILVNLLHNAIKFTAQGYVAVRAYNEENNVVIAVSDSGPGMPSHVVEKLFADQSMFTSSVEQRKQGGTGIGMVLVREMSELLGAKIRCESTVGLGTTFYLTLPNDTDKFHITHVEQKDRMLIWLQGDFSPPKLSKSTQDALIGTLKDIGADVLVPTCTTDLEKLDCSNVHAAFISSDILLRMDEFRSNFIKHLGNEKIICVLKNNDLSSHPNTLRCPLLPSMIWNAISASVFDSASDGSAVTVCPRPSSSSVAVSTNHMPVFFNIAGVACASASETTISALLAEDNFVVRKVMGNLFENLFVRCIIVEDGMQAIEKLQTQRFDIVFLDVEMPKKSGPEVAEWIRMDERENGVTEPVPIVGLSGHSEEEAVVMFGKNVTSCLSKPVGMENLVMVLESLTKYKRTPIRSSQSFRQELSIRGPGDT
eukprot:PhF_6_TR34145/c0_g1_i1/m.49875